MSAVCVAGGRSAGRLPSAIGWGRRVDRIHEKPSLHGTAADTLRSMLEDGEDIHFLLALVEASTGLRDLTAQRDLGGSYSSNILATGSAWTRPVVVRIHQDFVTPERLAAEQVARRALAAEGIPVALPYELTAGETSARLIDGRMLEVEPFVDAPDRMDTPDRLVTGAGVLARVHDALRRAELPDAARIARYANHLPTELAAPRVAAGAERIRSWGDAGLSAFAGEVTVHIEDVVARESAFVPTLPRQIVHGDFWDNNVLFRDGQVAVVLDLGFMARRARIDDLAYPMNAWLLRDGHGLPGPEDLDLFARMCDAYDDQAMCPLSVEERAGLPLAVARQPAWSVGRWVLELEDDEARDHARSARDEFPVSRAVLELADQWAACLTSAAARRKRDQDARDAPSTGRRSSGPSPTPP